MISLKVEVQVWIEYTSIHSLNNKLQAGFEPGVAGWKAQASQLCNACFPIYFKIQTRECFPPEDMINVVSEKLNKLDEGKSAKIKKNETKKDR